MKELKNKDKQSSAAKDYLQGIIFLVIPIIIIYLIIKFL
jgi:hypothetical protein